jgi:hypothetical protein
MAGERRERRDRYAPSRRPTNRWASHQSRRGQQSDDRRHERGRPLSKEEDHERHSRLSRSRRCFTRNDAPDETMETGNEQSPLFTLSNASARFVQVQTNPPRTEAVGASRRPHGERQSVRACGSRPKPRAARGRASVRLEAHARADYPRRSMDEPSLKCSVRSADDRASRRSHRRGEYPRLPCRDCAPARGAMAPG